MTLAVYAVTDARSAPPATGVRGERLRLYRAGAIAAVAGEVRSAPAAVPDNLRRYDGTLRHLAASLPALLPVRFGTCVADAEDLGLILRSRQAALRRALGRVRNRVQMTVRVPGALPGRESSDGVDEGVARRSKAQAAGTQYLRARADAAARAREVPGFEPVRAAVRRWLRDERVERRGPTASVYHLIPRAAAGSYQRAAIRAAAAAGLPVVVTGPWPPYAFAETW